ncbi:LPS export ABC transporter periplasmic protein LptC [Fodinibius saliphilus]|uniref:LPS export ABC transporter periplasmic protein LptC n=1 Tax=Fodinibius saliphilus TaxID=1920650 RepID=UPI00148708BE|nr:LPS export ABC transporter periplasmic protein LptC [Fodinibius saliphilus]
MTDTLVPYNTFSALAISLLIIAVISACGDLSEKQSKQVDEALQDSLTSTTETWGVDMDITEDGLKKIRLQGSYAATYNTKNRNETHIDGPVTIHVYDSSGTIKTRAFSNRAIYKTEEAIFELYGDVRVNTEDSRHLESEYLEWEQDKNMINTSKFVIITTPTDSIAGTGFEGTTDLTNYSIKEPKGRVTVN